jgi:hypothetical protein
MRLEIQILEFHAHQQEIFEMNSSSKVVVITGCGSGFGEGAIKAFADKGYRAWTFELDLRSKVEPW